MSKFLSKVTSGKVKKPYLVLIYGPGGAGKSTFGAEAPNPIFIQLENGTDHLSTNRLPAVTAFSEVLAQIQELTSEAHKFETLVIDSLDWLEPLVWQAVCREDDKGANTLDKVGGGYGKGYERAMDKWGGLRQALNDLREKRGMNIILIAHSQIKTFNDPQHNISYDRYIIKLHDKAAGLFKEFVDTVLFATFEVHAKADGGKKSKVFGDGSRVCFTQWRPGFDAKNRLGLPFKIPTSWNDFVIASQTERPAADIRSNIEELLKETKDEELKAKVAKAVIDAADDTMKLIAYENKLRTIVGG